MLRSPPATPVQPSPVAVDHVNNLEPQHPLSNTNANNPSPLTTRYLPPTSPPPPQTLPMVSNAPSQGNKNFKDLYGYEDEWDGWDGPIWCSRYGRFESQKDAAFDDDDGYTMRSQNPYKDIPLAPAGCDCRLPGGHKSYVRDIQRRVEPMVDSLVKLEAKMEKLLQHIREDGKSLVYGGHDGVVAHENRVREQKMMHENGGHENRGHENQMHENQTREWADGKSAV